MAIRKDKKNKRQPAWILDYRNENNKRQRLRVYCTKSVAETKYGIIISEIEKRKAGLSNGNRYILLRELIRKYLIVSEVDGKSPLTVRRIKNVTDAFGRIIGDLTPISNIEPSDIEDYKQRRLGEYTPRKKKLSNAGLNVELKHLRAMFNWSFKMGFLARSPMLAIKLVKIEEKRIRFLTPSELKSLFTVIDDSNDVDAKDLITFYLQTGARRSEILPEKFSWMNVNLNKKIIVLVGKRKKRRTLPLNDSLIQILRRRESNDYPFNISPDQVSRLIQKYYRLAGIKNANVHTLRKTCGSLLIQEGVDIYRVSKWLGHSTVEVTTSHYVDLLKSEFEDISLIIDKATINLMA